MKIVRAHIFDEKFSQSYIFFPLSVSFWSFFVIHSLTLLCQGKYHQGKSSCFIIDSLLCLDVISSWVFSTLGFLICFLNYSEFGKDTLGIAKKSSILNSYFYHSSLKGSWHQIYRFENEEIWRNRVQGHWYVSIEM